VPARKFFHVQPNFVLADIPQATDARSLQPFPPLDVARARFQTLNPFALMKNIGETQFFVHSPGKPQS
jgi:hypothetical protein